VGVQECKCRQARHRTVDECGGLAAPERVRQAPVTQKRPVSTRRRRSSSGNTIIETVFTILPTFALICAFADFGLVIFRWSTMQNAIREGCRYAITFQTTTGSGQDASIKAVVEQYAFGLVKANDSPQHIFVNYYAPSDLNTAIATGGNVPGNLVEVSVQNISWPWLAPLSGALSWGLPVLRSSTPVTFSIYSSDVLGGYPAGVNSVTR
jgi:Flp pilus assembly protein TadG